MRSACVPLCRTLSLSKTISYISYLIWRIHRRSKMDTSIIRVCLYRQKMSLIQCEKDQICQQRLSWHAGESDSHRITCINVPFVFFLFYKYQKRLHATQFRGKKRKRELPQKSVVYEEIKEFSPFIFVLFFCAERDRNKIFWVLL